MAEEVLLVISTFPDAEAARRIATVLVTEKLAACVNMIPGVQSIYRWEGKIEEGGEVIALLKTTRHRLPGLQTRLRELHPYEVPELLALQVADGSPDYLRWVAENCSPL